MRPKRDGCGAATHTCDRVSSIPDREIMHTTSHVSPAGMLPVGSPRGAVVNLGLLLSEHVVEKGAAGRASCNCGKLREALATGEATPGLAAQH